ncbi:MAG: DUF4405 domain-containing protein [Firmicutes bacterium]|nr:DUF4405 domain-containing protein [Bacillota bacterium]
MKKTNCLKLFLDIVIAVLLILMFNRMATGQEYHEVGGLVLGLIALVHLVLNWPWVKRVTVNFFKSSVTTRARVCYLVSLLLFLGGVFMVVSGLSISKAILADTIRPGGSLNLRMLHESVPYLGLLLVGIHVGLNWNWVTAVFRSITGLKPGNPALKHVARAAVVLLLVFGIYSSVSTGYFTKAFRFTSGSGQPPARIGAVENSPGQRAGVPRMEMNLAQNSGPGFPPGPPPGNRAVDYTAPASYLGILSAFSVVTFYTDRLLARAFGRTG